MTLLLKKLNYIFKNNNLLKLALTHKSYNLIENNERLEFLGDSIIGMFLACTIFKNFPDFDEGSMSQIKSNMESGITLVEIAKTLKLEKYIFLGNNVQINTKILSSSLEAIIGAIFIDSNDYNIVHECIHNLYKNLEFKLIDNPKLDLASLMQKNRKPLPIYKLVYTNDLDHKKEFTIIVDNIVDNITFTAKGKSIKDAEKQVAKQILEYLCKME